MFRIAIWNKNKFPVAIAVIAWVTNVSFIIQGKSFPPVDCRESHTNMILYQLSRGWIFNLSFFGPHRLIYLQLRATWDPALQTCVMPNINEIKPTLLTTLIADTVLLVTMLVGLFPLFVDGSSSFGLGRLLWKQVRSSCFPFTVRSSH